MLAVSGSDGADDVVRRFDERAVDYDESVAHRWQAERAVAVAGLRPGQRVLDVATGTGLAARLAADVVGREGEVVGVDRARRMLEVARRSSPPNCRYVHGDGVRLPAAIGRFDHVLCVAGLPYLGDPRRALGSWRAAMNDGGQITFTVPADDGLDAFTLLREAATAEGIALATPNAGLGSAEALHVLAERLGLAVRARVEETFDDGPLDGDPNAVADSYLGLGHAQPLRAAPPGTRDAVIDRFVGAYERRRGTASRQVLVLASLTGR